MANKMTKVETIQSIINKYAVGGEDKAFLEHEIELINKRNAHKSDKPTKKQTENEGLKARLYEAMELGKTYTATQAGALIEVSAQKATPLLNAMVERGVVVKTTEKRVSYFALVNPAEVQ